MKEPAIVVILVTFAILITFFIAPEEKSNSLKESIRRTSGDLSQKCLDDVRVGLNDPDSARIVSFKPVELNTYLLKYKSKNPAGGYYYGEIKFNSSGKQIGH